MFRREKKEQDAPLIDSLIVGVAVVDDNHAIARYNRAFYDMFRRSNSDDGWNEEFKGKDFYRIVGHLFFETGCCAPFHFVKETGETKTVTLVNGYSPTSGINPAYFAQDASDASESKNFEMFVSPYGNKFLVEILDRSDFAHLEKRMQVLQNAGAQLMSTIDRKLYHLPVDEQKEALKEIITEHMRETLRYDVVEIRIVDDDAVTLLPYLNFGVDPKNASRILKISSNGQGITGYVADTGEEYICNDTLNDPHYLEGAIDARSSLTVPLVYDNQVLGVINVERAGVVETQEDGTLKKTDKVVPFTRQDALFLKLYAKDLAFALHLLHFSQLQRNKVRQVCADSIKNNLRDKIDELFPLIHSAIPSRDELSVAYFNLKDAYEGLLQFVNSASKEIVRASSAAEDTKKRLPSLEDSLRLIAANKTKGKTNGSVGAYDRAKNFFAEHPSKFLLITPQERSEIVLDEWLNELGAQYDVAPSTSVALNALAGGKYDFVIIHKYGDGGTGVDCGLYFSEKETSADRLADYKRNSNGRSPVDIHRSGYEVPVEGDEFDAQLRQRVLREIDAGKRDAYFFMQALIDLNLPQRPTCVFTSIIGEYDGTHVYADMVENLEIATNKLLALDYLGRPTPNGFVVALDAAIQRRREYLQENGQK